MSKKLRMILVAVILAIVAITVGLCCIFLGNSVIKDVPNDLHIEKIDNNFYLVTNFNAKYHYQFKLETFVDDEFLTVSVVNSDANCLNLSAQNISVVAGKLYRFSACFISSDGNGSGGYSQDLEWEPSWQLDEVQDVVFDKQTNTLSWREVYLADNYEVRLVAFDGAQTTETCQETHIDLGQTKAGRYKVYVLAKSDNSNLASSGSGNATEVCIEKTAEIVSAERDEAGNIKLVCTQEVTEFELYVNGELKATIETQGIEKGNLFEFSLNTDFLLTDVDFENNVVQVKASGSYYVNESALVQIN